MKTGGKGDLIWTSELCYSCNMSGSLFLSYRLKYCTQLCTHVIGCRDGLISGKLNFRTVYERDIAHHEEFPKLRISRENYGVDFQHGSAVHTSALHFRNDCSPFL